MTVAVEQLEAAIKYAVQELQLDPKNKHVQDAIKNLTHALGGKDNTLYASDLKNNEAFKLAFKNQLFKEYNPSLEINPAILFKPQKELKPGELEKEIKKLLLAELSLTPKFRKMTDKEKEKELNAVDQVAAGLAKQMMSEQDKQSNDLLCQNKKAFGFFDKGFDGLKDVSELIHQLFGVSKPGEIFRPVFAVTAGNRAGVPDLVEELGNSFMASLDKTDGPDYNGTQALNLSFQIADGSITTPQEADFERALGGESRSPSPFPDISKGPSYNQ